jgi:hypothetical protein
MLIPDFDSLEIKGFHVIDIGVGISSISFQIDKK